MKNYTDDLLNVNLYTERNVKITCHDQILFFPVPCLTTVVDRLFILVRTFVIDTVDCT